jgi:hypothetical protein
MRSRRKRYQQYLSTPTTENHMKTANNKIRFSRSIQMRTCLIFNGFWVKGSMDNFDFEATLDFDQDDEAINKGHIVKLDVEYMGGDKCFDIPRPMVIYSRKWVDPPLNDDEKEYFNSIIALLESTHIQL